MGYLTTPNATAPSGTTYYLKNDSTYTWNTPLGAHGTVEYHKNSDPLVSYFQYLGSNLPDELIYLNSDSEAYNGHLDNIENLKTSNSFVTPFNRLKQIAIKAYNKARKIIGFENGGQVMSDDQILQLLNDGLSFKKFIEDLTKFAGALKQNNMIDGIAGEEEISNILRENTQETVNLVKYLSSNDLESALKSLAKLNIVKLSTKALALVLMGEDGLKTKNDSININKPTPNENNEETTDDYIKQWFLENNPEINKNKKITITVEKKGGNIPCHKCNKTRSGKQLLKKKNK